MDAISKELSEIYWEFKQYEIDHSKDGDVIHIRNGKYKIKRTII